MADKSHIGKDYAKVTMARSIRKKVHKADNESESDVLSVKRGVVQEIVNKSVGDGDVLHRVAREASLVPRKSADVKLDRKDSKFVNKSVKGVGDLNRVERDDGAPRKHALSRIKHQGSMVAPLAVNMSQVTLRFVSVFL